MAKSHGQMLSLASRLSDGLDDDLTALLQNQPKPDPGAGGGGSEEPAKEEPKEEEEEVSEEEAAAGLGALFG